jgi:hypothetical protein
VPQVVRAADLIVASLRFKKTLEANVRRANTQTTTRTNTQTNTQADNADKADKHSNKHEANKQTRNEQTGAGAHEHTGSCTNKQTSYTNKNKHTNNPTSWTRKETNNQTP